MSGLIVVGGLAAAGLAALILMSRDEDKAAERWMALKKGKRYAIAARFATVPTESIPQSPGFDTSQFPGFCNFSTPAIIPAPGGGAGYEVQFTADWCANDMMWLVPQFVAVAEV